MCNLASSIASYRKASPSFPTDSLDIRFREGTLGSSDPILASIESRVLEASSMFPVSRDSEYRSISRAREASSLSSATRSEMLIESASDNRVSNGILLSVPGILSSYFLTSDDISALALSPGFSLEIAEASNSSAFSHSPSALASLDETMSFLGPSLRDSMYPDATSVSPLSSAMSAASSKSPSSGLDSIA